MKPSSLPPPRPRTKPPEVRREELLDAAEKLFLEQGVAATSVDQIVEAADVAKGTFYLYFPSKEQLLAALQQRFVASFRDHLRAALNRPRAGDWKGRLRAWVRAGVEGYLDRLALHDLVFHQFRPEDPRRKHANPIVDELAEFLRQGARAGAWSLADPDLTAVMLFGAFHAAVDDALTAKREVDRKRVARAVEAFFRRTVGDAIPR